ncbi:phage tail protein [Maridesulfovibrio sp.]|uniref:phage tail protein n=1 Tax=Maridesulfovibrio sp. TaxID=2795000 RepID=UPI002A18A5E3|nr:phage tail protein [Maridesulfovibrio sp.]
MIWDYFKNTLRWPLVFRPGPLSALVKGGARAMEQAYEDILWLVRQADPAQADSAHLHYHSASRGTPRWPDEPESFYRKRIVYAYAWQAQAGRSAGLVSILKEAGISAEIYEPSDLTQMVDPNTPRLDGRDLGFAMITPRDLKGFPSLGWAEFLVNMNWGSMEDGQYQLARKIVAEYKAARSLDKFRIYLGLRGPAPRNPESKASAVAGSIIPQPAALRLDGSWTLGRDEGPTRLKGQSLGFKLGEIIPGAVTKQIKNDRLSTNVHGAMTLTIKPGEPTLQREPLGRLSEKLMRLDGAWNVGTGLILNGSWNLSGETRLVEAARLGSLPDHRLNGQLRLGVSKPVCTTWPSVN